MQAQISSSTMMQKRQQQQQQSSNKVISMVLLLLLACCIQSAESRSAASDQQDQSELSTTSTPIPTAYLENTDEASVTSDEGSDEVDTVCYSCHDTVEEAKEMIKVYTEMVKKEKAFINRQRQKISSAPSRKYSADHSSNNNNSNNNTTSSSSNNNSKPNRVNERRALRDSQDHSTAELPNKQASLTSTITSRTLHDAESRFTIVSRLRVARSADGQLSMPAAGDRPSWPKKNKDSVLKQMRYSQQIHLNETCKALERVQGCLKSIEDKCLGDLQYHSLESVVEQWLQKYSCLQRLSPRTRFWTGLKTMHNTKTYTEIPRPISSPEEVRKRLDKLLGYAEEPSPRPTVGVMLKPGLTQLASQRFNTIPSSRAQQFQAGPMNSKYNSAEHQIMPLASQLLLIPCFLVVLIVVITIVNHFFTTRGQKVHDQR